MSFKAIISLTGNSRIPALDSTRRSVSAGRTTAAEPHVATARFPPGGHREKAGGVQDPMSG